MAESKHTPTPWHVNGDNFAVEHQPTSYIGDKRTVALCATGEGAMANAMFIVRACNAHDELLAVAKRALNFVEYTEAERGVVLVSGNELRAAIAKAEG